MTAFPSTQYAVQLVGPGQLRLNTAKPVPVPGPHEVLIKIEACGLCFSDLKLLKQFSGHARKSEIIRGFPADELKQVQSYVPGETPSVPGHEVVCRIVAVGSAVTRHKVGERCLVQTDYRELLTAKSNAAFGYNFEGGLQEYCIVDERVATDPRGDRFLIPVSEQKSASAVALVEPWACVENSYVNPERRGIKPGGRLLIVGTSGLPGDHWLHFSPATRPAEIRHATAAGVAALANEYFDDIIYFGSDRTTIEILSDKLANHGLINLVLGGAKIGAPTTIGIGRVHYGMCRWTGTTGHDPADGYRRIPVTAEIRAGDSIVVIGAGGPMGQMHIIRNICSGVPGIAQVGTDIDDGRLASLEAKARSLATARGTPLRLVNTTQEQLESAFTYWALMVPDAALVARAIAEAAPHAIINIFAGIPAPTKQAVDLDAYIEKHLYMNGTSGSVIEDMRIVLRNVESGSLDTNLSLDAVAGMAGAIAGIAAIENRTLAGKIIVYPMLHNMPLIPLAELHKHYPSVAAKLANGQWTRAAEEELLRVGA